MTRVGLLLFEAVDLLDVGGPYEILLTANRLAERAGTPTPFEVLALGLDAAPVTAYGGLGLVPVATLGEAPPLDVLVVPGAIDVDGTLAAPDLVEVVRSTARAVPLVASVCTGAFVLGRAGLLAGRAWTTHWEDLPALAAEVGEAGARPGQRVVDDAGVVTGGGLSCGLDVGLHLVHRLAGLDLARATAHQVDHPWQPLDTGADTSARPPRPNGQGATRS